MSSVEAAISALEGQRGALGDAVVDTARAPLVDRRDRLRSAPAGEQRKMVTGRARLRRVLALRRP